MIVSKGVEEGDLCFNSIGDLSAKDLIDAAALNYCRQSNKN